MCRLVAMRCPPPYSEPTLVRQRRLTADVSEILASDPAMRHPLSRESHVWYSPLSPTQCAAALRAQLVPWWGRGPWLLFSSGAEAQPLTGRVSDRGFVVRRFIRYSNGFQTEARGRFIAINAAIGAAVAVDEPRTIAARLPPHRLGAEWALPVNEFQAPGPVAP
jgi:hypothetical protein